MVKEFKKKLKSFNKKNNLLIYADLANLITYKKIFFKHPYTQNNLPFFLYIKQISFYLKKNLHIIYKYHLYKKKIIWIEEKFYKLKKKKLYYAIKKAKHSFITKSTWMNGLISNQNFVYEHLKNKKQKIFKQINKNPQLNIISESWDVINSECYNKRIPQIFLNNNFTIQDYYIKKTYSSYRININFKITLKKKIQNYFLNIISKLIKLI